MVNKSRLRLVVAGAGLVGRRHIQAAKQINQVEICAIVDPNAEALTFAEGEGLSHYNDLEDLFDTENPDGVILSTPTGLHVEQGLVCLNRNTPILVEKPIAVQADEALGMVELGESKNIPILVGHHRRHNPIIQAAKQAIEQGAIGDLRALTATCWFYKPDHYFEVAPWRKAHGAGPISVNLVHDVDLIRYLCGEVVSVDARAMPARRGFENEDVAAAILTFENGAIATVTVADAVVSPWSWEQTSGEYPIYPKTDQNCYMIGGSEGALSVPDLKLWRHQEEPDWWTPIAAQTVDCEHSDPLVTQIAHFADVILGNCAPLVSGREGLRTLQVVEAIQNSAKTGDTIFISDLDQTGISKKTAI